MNLRIAGVARQNAAGQGAGLGTPLEVHPQLSPGLQGVLLHICVFPPAPRVQVLSTTPPPLGSSSRAPAHRERDEAGEAGTTQTRSWFRALQTHDDLCKDRTQDPGKYRLHPENPAHRRDMAPRAEQVPVPAWVSDRTASGQQSLPWKAQGSALTTVLRSSKGRAPRTPLGAGAHQTMGSHQLPK